MTLLLSSSASRLLFRSSLTSLCICVTSPLLCAVVKLSKRVMLSEEEKRKLEADLEQSHRELSSLQAKHRVVSASLENAVSWDEHCHLTGKLKRY